LEWNAKEERDPILHPLLRIAVFNVVFLAIHPFQDGNGRLSRVLTNLNASALGLRLCLLQLARKRDRAQQGSLQIYEAAVSLGSEHSMPDDTFGVWQSPSRSAPESA
jgi:Fic family protein